MADLAGKRVLVTGAGRNIGLAIARAFLAEGARVLINDATAEIVSEGLATLKSDRATGFAADVRDAESVQAMVDRMTEVWDGVDILVNNAGVYPTCPVLDLPASEWDRVMEINARGTFLAAQRVGRQMVAQGTGGYMINIASAAHQIGRPGAAAYCASKAAIVALTRVLAIELAPHGIFVNAIAPGLIENGHLSEAYTEAYVRNVPLGRIGKPEEIAAGCLMLVKSGCTYLTGQVIGVDGGVTAGRPSLPAK